jgi:hypothetical protein
MHEIIPASKYNASLHELSYACMHEEALVECNLTEKICLLILL